MREILLNQSGKGYNCRGIIPFYIGMESLKKRKPKTSEFGSEIKNHFGFAQKQNIVDSPRGMSTAKLKL